ncbi:MAG TPA: hypothetical protein VFB07_09850 [Vicinamibacterales bacterium]|nr:hypothetical protein [Vicinamibacterales bacterium]
MIVRNVCVRRGITAVATACAMALPAIAAAQLPNNYYTPGKAEKVDVKALCSASYDGSSKPASDWQKAEALTRYGVRPESFGGELEHLVPVALGGSNDPDNLYPFHGQGEYTLEAKQRLAAKLHELVCDGKISLKQAQDVFKKDWTKGYKQYVGAMNAPGGN